MKLLACLLGGAACAVCVSLAGCGEPHDVVPLLGAPSAAAGAASAVGDPAAVVTEAALAGASNEPVLDLDTGTPTSGEARER
jgi:hypothetical protein